MSKYEPKSTPNPAGISGMGGRSKYTRSRRAFEWNDVGRDVIGQLVIDVCDCGNGLVLGRTADLGALSITVLQGEERIREWPASVEDFLTFANWCGTHLGGVDNDNDAGGSRSSK